MPHKNDKCPPSSLPGSPGPSILLKFERPTQGAPCLNTKALGQLGSQARVAPWKEPRMAAAGTVDSCGHPTGTAVWGLGALEDPAAWIFQWDE